MKRLILTLILSFFFVAWSQDSISTEHQQHSRDQQQVKKDLVYISKNYRKDIETIKKSIGVVSTTNDRISLSNEKLLNLITKFDSNQEDLIRRLEFSENARLTSEMERDSLLNEQNKKLEQEKINKLATDKIMLTCLLGILVISVISLVLQTWVFNKKG